jgi:hypothetical protein
MNELAIEFKEFQKNILEWRKDHLGEFVLIKGKDVVGFYASLQDAFAKGSSLYGLEPFFIKQIVPGDSVNVSLMGRRIKAA